MFLTLRMGDELHVVVHRVNTAVTKFIKLCEVVNPTKAALSIEVESMRRRLKGE